MNSAQRVMVSGPSESTWTPFCSESHTFLFFARSPRLSGKCPPVCSSWNCPTRKVGTVMFFTHAPGARSSNSEGVRFGLPRISFSASWVCRRRA
jgi:hypothetical protein